DDLVGAEVLVLDEVQLRVVVVERLLDEVQDVRVRRGVTGRRARVVLVERLVPAHGDRGVGLDTAVVAAGAGVAALVRGCARGDGERRRCGSRNEGGKAPDLQCSS